MAQEANDPQRIKAMKGLRMGRDHRSKAFSSRFGTTRTAGYGFVRIIPRLC
jgi:hypothetical protein